MSLITSSIPNLVNGISQQPDILRLSSQGDTQINMNSSVAEGLQKRPPMEHVARLAGVSENAFLHTINRDINERYVVTIESGVVKVFDVDGTEKTVTVDLPDTYLTTDNPLEDLQCMTVADFTFILNKQVTARALPTLTPTRAPEALVWIKAGSYGGVYTIFVDGVNRASYTVPDGSVASHTASVRTDNIATQLSSGLASSIGTTFNIARSGSTLHIKRVDGGDFNIRIDSNAGDTQAQSIKGTVQSFSDLPARAVNNFYAEVVGQNNAEDDNYYVSFDTGDAGTDRDGVWREVLKEGETFRIDGATMPHALVRNANGTFTLKPLTWTDREVGDSISAPLPSFIDRKIADLFFYRNRLGFAADESLVFSKSGDFFNFFRGTAKQVLDDDPIDINVSHVKVSLLKQAVPFNEALLLFSDQTQFQTGAAASLTPETISINPTTEYECSLKAKPVGVGKYVYFATTHGNFAGVREYFVDKDTESEQAAEITAHIPKYLEGNVRYLSASSSEDMLVVLTEGALDTVYIYKYYFSGDDKLQASWSKWQTADGAPILSASFIESTMYLLVKRVDGVHLERLNLSAQVFETGWNVRVHLDSKVYSQNLTSVIEEGVPTLSGNDPTAVTLPYTLNDVSEVVLVTGPNGTTPAGTLLNAFQLDNTGPTTKLYFDTPLVGEPFFIGRLYSSRYRLSRLLVKESKRDGSQVPITSGRLQLRKGTLELADTGYLRVEVTPSNRQTYTYVYTGNRVGTVEAVVGEINIADGTLSFPIQAQNKEVQIDLINDSFLPSSILSLDWEGFYTARAQRI